MAMSEEVNKRYEKMTNRKTVDFFVCLEISNAKKRKNSVNVILPESSQSGRVDSRYGGVVPKRSKLSSKTNSFKFVNFFPKATN